MIEPIENPPVGQGKRQEQVEFSQRMVFVSIILGLIVLGIVFICK